MNESKPYFRYNIGDLVEFTHGFLGAAAKLTGIVVDQSYKGTKNNVFKIKVKEKYYWISAPRITLLSKAMKAPSK